MKEIPLTQGYIALVSDEDFERVNVFKWCLQKQKKKYRTALYAKRHGPTIDGKQTIIWMHRLRSAGRSRLTSDHPVRVRLPTCAMSRLGCVSPQIRPGHEGDSDPALNRGCRGGDAQPATSRPQIPVRPW